MGNRIQFRENKQLEENYKNIDGHEYVLNMFL